MAKNAADGQGAATIGLAFSSTESRWYGINEHKNYAAQPVAGANMGGRSRFTRGRWDLPRHGSHVAQLWSLGYMTRLWTYLYSLL